MTNKTVFALNTASGQVGSVPEAYLTHPVLGRVLVEVPEGTKSFDPEKYQPTDVEGYLAKQESKKAAKSAKVDEKQPELPIVAGDAPSGS